MNRYLLYFVSLWGFSIMIGCILNHKYKNINDKNKYIILGWMLFGLAGFITHLRMIQIRNNPDINEASTVSTLNNKVHPSTSLIICTCGQIFVIGIYLYTREYFKIKEPTDIFVLLIIFTMFLRFIILANNGFKYTEKLLYKNAFDYYV